MGLLTFKGGIHPDDGKRFSKDQPIRPVVPQGELVYPLSQHIGAPAKPVVKKGDCVLKGQLIAEAGGFVSSPIYSSVSGKVKGLEQRFNPTGSQVECIVVENVVPILSLYRRQMNRSEKIQILPLQQSTVLSAHNRLS